MWCKKLKEYLNFDKTVKVGWKFVLNEEYENISLNGIYSDINVRLKILEKLLQALDTDIISVKKLEIDNSNVIKKDNQDIIVKEGEVIKGSKLSSGNIAGIKIANLISSIILKKMVSITVMRSYLTFILI